MAENSYTLCRSSFPSIMLILLTHSTTAPCPCHTGTFVSFFLIQGRSRVILKSEPTQFCDGLSPPGSYPAAASGCLKPRQNQAHFSRLIQSCQEVGGVCQVCIQEFVCSCMSWTNAKFRKSIEGCPNTSSLICINLPPCHMGKRAPARWYRSLTQSVLTPCLFIMQLLELLNVLMAYYPPDAFISRIRKTHSSFISVFIKKCVLAVKHCLCFIKLLKPWFSFVGAT